MTFRYLPVAGAFLLGATVSFAQLAKAEDGPAPKGPQPGSVYELTEPTETSPVNYRSNADEGYDNPEQHDAEMYAEQFEAKRREDLIHERQQLDRLDDFAGGRQPLGYPALAPRNGFAPY
ncbi:MAG: hypothetical protein WBN97_11005 [Parvibaculum sp.]